MPRQRRAITRGEAYYRNQQWREAYRALERVERLAPNYLQTRWLLAEVLGKLGDTPPAPSESDPSRSASTSLFSTPFWRDVWSPSWGRM